MTFYITLSVFIILISLLLIGIVLIQKSKGGGLASSFAGANQVLGVRHTNSAIEKITWWLIGLMWLLCVLSTYALPGASSATTDMRVKDAPVQTQLPAAGFDSPAPTTDQAAAEAAPAEAASTVGE